MQLREGDKAIPTQQHGDTYTVNEHNSHWGVINMRHMLYIAAMPDRAGRVRREGYVNTLPIRVWADAAAGTMGDASHKKVGESGSRRATKSSRTTYRNVHTRCEDRSIHINPHYQDPSIYFLRYLA